MARGSGSRSRCRGRTGKGAGIKTLRTILSLPFYVAAVLPLAIGLAILLVLAQLVQGDNS